LLYVIVAILSIAAIFFVGLRVNGVPAERVDIVPYSELEQALVVGRVDHVVVSDREIRAHLKVPDSKGVQVLAANRVEPDLAERLSRFNVPYTREYGSSGLSQLLGWVVPGLMFVGLWYFMIRGSAGGKSGMGLLSVGNSHAKV